MKSGVEEKPVFVCKVGIVGHIVSLYYDTSTSDSYVHFPRLGDLEQVPTITIGFESCSGAPGNLASWHQVVKSFLHEVLEMVLFEMGLALQPSRHLYVSSGGKYSWFFDHEKLDEATMYTGDALVVALPALAGAYKSLEKKCSKNC